MPSPATFPRDRFASLLAEAAAAGSFSARRTARPDDLLLEVNGVGSIALPVSVWQAKQLCLIGRPARFGKGELTLLDAKVRDTWEIPKSRLRPIPAGSACGARARRAVTRGRRVGRTARVRAHLVARGAHANAGAAPPSAS
jgi:hypothetical protein